MRDRPPAMLKAPPFIVPRKWPFPVAFTLGFAVGYAFGGSTLGALGGGVGAVCLLIWNAFRNRGELLNSYRQLKLDYPPAAVPVGDRRPNATILWVALGYVVALFGYNLLTAGAHDSFADWIGALSPLADWMAKFVPALERIPQAITEKGYAGWAPVAHHLLFVDWVLTIAMMVLILFDFAFIQGRAFSRAILLGRRQQLKMIATSAVLVAVSFLFLFFGWFPLFGWFPRSRDLVGIFGSLLIAGLSVCTVFFWACFVLFCNGLVRGRDISDADAAAAMEAQRKTQEMLRRLLGGKV